METTKPESVAYKQCSKCKETKELDHFYTSGITCRDCKNTQRREKYNNDDEHRKKLIQFASKFKHDKVLQNHKIGEQNLLMRHIYGKTRFERQKNSLRT